MKLGKALREQRYVTVERGRREEHRGFVVDVGEEWFVLLHAPHVLHAGLLLLRVDDVTRVRKRARGGRTRRALELDGLWPPTAPASLDLDDVRSVLFTAGSLARALGLGREDDHPGLQVCSVERITQRRLHGREVTPGGSWGPPVKVPLARLTKVTLWDPYVEKLVAVADAAPAQSPASKSRS